MGSVVSEVPNHPQENHGMIRDFFLSFLGLGEGRGCAVLGSALGRFAVFRMLVHRRAYHSSSWFVK